MQGMDRKAKGTKTERELIHLFWSRGWAAVRVAGSGSIKYPVPDIVAGNGVRHLAIECKSSGERRRYLTKEEVGSLVEFARRFGAEPWIGARFDAQSWYFIAPHDLEGSGKLLVVDAEKAKHSGILFEELIG